MKNSVKNRISKGAQHITYLSDTKLCLNTEFSFPSKNHSFFKKQSKGIRILCNSLQNLQIVYSTEVYFGACHYYKPLPFDIMVVIKDKIGLIEYDGYQHFHQCEFTKTKTDLINQQTRDLLKTIFCKKHSISLLRIAYDASETEIQDYLIRYLEHLNDSLTVVYIFNNNELYKDHLKLCKS